MGVELFRCQGESWSLPGLGLRVEMGLGFGVQGLGFRVWVLGFRVSLGSKSPNPIHEVCAGC